MIWSLWSRVEMWILFQTYWQMSDQFRFSFADKPVTKMVTISDWPSPFPTLISRRIRRRYKSKALTECKRQWDTLDWDRSVLNALGAEKSNCVFEWKLKLNKILCYNICYHSLFFFVSKLWRNFSYYTLNLKIYCCVFLSSSDVFFRFHLNCQ